MSTSTDRSRNSVSKRPQKQASSDRVLQPTKDVVEYVREYARQKPDVAALWCFGLGIVVGWKAKPW